jgi:hypothetical protein
MAEVQAGLREDSVVSSMTTDILTGTEEEIEKELWIELSRELQDVGITTEMLKLRRDFIIAWFVSAKNSGQLDEKDPEAESDRKGRRCSTESLVTSAHRSSSEGARLSTKLPDQVLPLSWPGNNRTVELPIGRGFPSFIDTLTLDIGNTHRLIQPRNPTSSNEHEWTFFVRPSRVDIIEKVQIILVSILPSCPTSIS